MPQERRREVIPAFMQCQFVPQAARISHGIMAAYQVANASEEFLFCLAASLQIRLVRPGIVETAQAAQYTQRSADQRVGKPVPGLLFIHKAGDRDIPGGRGLSGDPLPFLLIGVVRKLPLLFADSSADGTLPVHIRQNIPFSGADASAIPAAARADSMDASRWSSPMPLSEPMRSTT